MKTTLLTLMVALLGLPSFAQDIHKRRPGKIIHELHKGYLGVMLTADENNEEGVVISKVMPDSPAAKAGLEKGTTVLALNGNKVTEVRELVNTLGNFEAGDEVVLKILNGGESDDITVVLGSRGERHALKVKPGIQGNRWVEVLHESKNYIGIHMKTLNEQLAAYFQVTNGVLVEEVMDESPAKQGGLQAGDVIVKWGDINIESTEDLYKALRQIESGKAVEVSVVRRGEDALVSVIPEEREGLPRAFSSRGKLLPDGNFEFQMPKMPKVQRFYNFEDQEDLREELEELKEQMKALREELKKK